MFLTAFWGSIKSVMGRKKHTIHWPSLLPFPRTTGMNSTWVVPCLICKIFWTRVVEAGVLIAFSNTYKIQLWRQINDTITFKCQFTIFIQASEDDKDKTLLKYYAKTIVFVLAYSKQRYRGNQAGNNDVKRLSWKKGVTFVGKSEQNLAESIEEIYFFSKI